jgi:predicted GIY-YIG superfamily endonuclease
MSDEGCYVYIIGTTTGAYKIGVANDPYARYEALKPGIPDPSSIKLVILCRDRRHAFAVESDLHEELEEYHSVGEWFRPPKSVLGELLLELGTKITSLVGCIPTVEYCQNEPRSANTHNQDDIARHTSRYEVKKIISDLETRCGSGQFVAVESVIDLAAELGIDRIRVGQILYKLDYDGEIFSPRPGCVKCNCEGQ